MQTSRVLINVTDKAIFVYTACGKQVLLHPFSVRRSHGHVTRVLVETYNEPRKDFRTDSVNISNGSVKIVPSLTGEMAEVVEPEVAECVHGALTYTEAGTRVPKKYFTQAKCEELFARDSESEEETDETENNTKPATAVIETSVTFTEAKKRRVVVEGKAADAQFLTKDGEIMAQDVRTNTSVTIKSGDAACGPCNVIAHNFDRTTGRFKTVLQMA